MILTPPFYLGGEDGKSLGASAVPLSVLGITDAVLSLRSLDVDTLTFSLRDNGSRYAIPDDGQWLSVYDATNQRLFTGIAKRSFEYPARIYRYEVANVYKGLLETVLTSNNRPFITYFADDAGIILHDILQRAMAAGLPLYTLPLDEWPALYQVPKISFRGSSYGNAIEELAKWLPDLWSRFDYSTNPPTIKFVTRRDSDVRIVDLEAEGHKATRLNLTAEESRRALSITFSYAKRNGDDIITLSQTAGDPSAEGIRTRSIYISGSERMDAFIAEALQTAKDAQIAAVSAGGTLPDNSGTLLPTWELALAKDYLLPSAVAQQPGFKMRAEFPKRKLYNGSVNEYTPNNEVTDNYTERTFDYYPMRVASNSSGSAAPGWFAVKDGWFSDDDLALVGVTKAEMWMVGHLFWDSGTDGGGSMASAALDYLDLVPGRRVRAISSYGTARSVWYRASFKVWCINQPPSLVENMILANNAGNLKFYRRAEYVDIPPDLAQNYFERQDWTPYKGSVAFAPSVAEIPAPGDFINVSGSGIPAEWATMKVPVAETSIDLATRAASVTIGPSPRQDFQSLIDRLRIPAEDNYQPG